MGGRIRRYGYCGEGDGHLHTVSGAGCTDVRVKKKEVKTDRPYNTALYLLRCVEAGIALPDLDFFEVGEIMDILTERGNDGFNYSRLATQEDMDRF